MEERIGEAFADDECFTVVGKKLQVGEVTPNFSLDYIDLIDMTVHCAQLVDSGGMIRIFSIVNSLTMPTCRRQTQHWEKLRSTFPPDVYLYTISMDLPHAQAQWQAAENIIHQILSAHRSEQFGQDYGVLLKEPRLLQRSTFVIDRDDSIAYAEYVADQQCEPRYDDALAAIFRIHTS